MNRHFKLLVSLLLTIMLAFGLSACGTSLQKPTGLEDEQGQIDREKDQKESEATDVNEEEEEKEPAEPIDNEQEPIVKNDKQVENKNKLNDEALIKPSEPAKEGNKQPSKPVVDHKKTVTTTPAPPAPVEAPVKKPAEQEKQPAPVADTVVYSIVISSETDEIPLSPTEIEIKEGDTVLQALINITKELGIQMDYRGGQGSTAYIEGIDNVYEFDRGQGSGWMYRVNGIFPDRGAGAVSLLAGDRVEWLYTTNLGVDLNANLQPFRR